ncbi:MAG: hypothetical protein K2P94_17650 [Rhodospirillaceae bacterium]|nr:hypothetical protein [Rhodospirillaceae bacterium]
MNRIFVALGVASGFLLSGTLHTVGAEAKDKAAVEKPHDHKMGDKDHADKGQKDKADMDKCAEMMAHNKAPDGGGAEADKKGCGMMMGKKKGIEKDHGKKPAD